ncbi:hypothetical protein JD844_010125 [Phrynosoma platyrhinos]|uniref:Growth hormone/erythropoietin receptor ligand binding domain-containing protein n=1 Tax=Phrynosoma platyrhinos TaxID=52577 RepID=A0ABQ7TGS3_PHRPL|nr:hypothetical protein JD844_010125 [Phrynosoma platyrhinos]
MKTQRAGGRTPLERRPPTTNQPHQYGARLEMDCRLFGPGALGLWLISGGCCELGALLQQQREDEYLTLCNLTLEHTPWNTTRYTCFFPRGDVSAFAPMEIKVFDEKNHTIYSRRDLYVERLNLDPLILTLSVILVLIVLILAFITFMSKHRFLKQKMWPVIPSPEHEFKDLFTIYKGNFQLWMGHQSAYLWWSQNSPYLEEQPFLVEVLSDCDGRKGNGPRLPPPLPPKTRNLVELPQTPEVSQGDYLVLDEDLVPCCLGGDASLLLLDSDSSKSLDPALSGRTRSPELSQTSSSFEYTVFDPSSESLCPQGRPQAEVQLKSSYQVVSDSGISADYSLAESSPGQASLYTNLCDGGPQPFLPTYIVCS